MTAFNYNECTVPPEYRCDRCGAHGCRLWRRYQTFLDQQTLLCADCVEQEAGELLEGRGHSIGWWVGAVPTEDGRAYWGLTSVPSAGVDWWEQLPTRAA